MRASNVFGPTSRVAERVIITDTLAPACTSRLTRAAVLKAAIPPLTPMSTLRPFIGSGNPVPAGRPAGADHLHFHLGIQENLVLQDFLDHDFHLVVGVHVDQRPGAAVDGHHALLDQCRQLETAADLVNDRLFPKFVNHPPWVSHC